MKISRKVCIIMFILFFILLFKMPAFAGPYTDELSKCMIESTSENDRIEFVKWLFAAMSRHPAVRSMTSLTEEEINEYNEKMAKLIMKILTDSCREKAGKAIKYEGEIALRTSFNLFGQVAAQELFSNTEVTAILSEMEKYFDVEKLKSALGIEDTNAGAKENIDTYNNVAQAHLRNAAMAQEAYYVDNNTYCDSVEKLEGDKYDLHISEGVILQIISAGKDQYHMIAFHEKGSKKYHLIGPGGIVEEYRE